MKMSKRSIQQIVEEQVKKWHLEHTASKTDRRLVPAVTISREPGSGGRILAEQLAQALGFDLFHQEMIHEMAKSANVSSRLLETLDERGLSVLEDWIAALVNTRHLWPDQYSQHLFKVVGTIGKHGRAVLVGRGANFILPPDKRFRVRIIAPQEFRVNRVAEYFSVSPEEAKYRIIRTENDRRAFIRKYFHADIEDPVNYDIVINTATVGIKSAVNLIKEAVAV